MAQLLINARRSTTVLTCLRRQIRAFSTPVDKPPAPSSSNPDPTVNLSRATHRVDNLEKKLLVWTGKYKTTDEVPTYVNQDVVEKARNRFRIRLANIIMAISLVACVCMALRGKKEAEKGYSVMKMNQDWHKLYNEKAEEEAKEALKSQK